MTVLRARTQPGVAVEERVRVADAPRVAVGDAVVDIEDLDPAADPQNGEPCIKRRVDQPKLKLVPLLVDVLHLLPGIHASVQPRMDVVPPAQHQRVAVPQRRGAPYREQCCR